MSTTLRRGAPTATADVLLADGTIAEIRPVRADDRAALETLHDEVSETSYRLRFFATGRTVGHQYVEHLFAGAGAEICLVALVAQRIVALATAERIDDDSAEVAFLVDDAHRGHGVGILLLEHLAAAGRDHGISRFTAEVLSENVAMSRVFTAAGFHLGRTTSAGVTDVEMSTTASVRAVAAADDRESRSEARSLSALATPHRVAVVGASRDGSGIGSAVLASIVAGDCTEAFTGETVAIHPSAVELAGIAAYPHLVDVPGHVDVVLVVVPAARVLAVLEDAVAAGASTVVVVSSGFEEVGAQGAELQHRLVRLARRHSIRLIGPNCLGVLVNDPAVRLNATFTSLVPPPGGLAVASQSGGVGIALLDVARRTGLGVHSFISLGNKADVSGNDLLAAWLADPRVSAAALYLESLGNAPKFARLARSFSERKPLLVVLGGRSTGGRRAGASHTAAATTASTVTVEALGGHSGVIGCRSAEEIAETALVLAQQPLPGGRRVAVLSNAGGMGVLAADAADGTGLVVPELSAALQRRLRTALPTLAGPGNPVDLGAGATAATMATTVSEVLASGEVDALLVVLVATRVGDPAPLEQALGEARAASPQIPVLLVSIGATGPPRDPPDAVTQLPSVSAAIRAMARVSRYAAWRAVPPEAPVAPDEPRASAARILAAEALSAGGEVEQLSADRATALLSPYGLAAANDADTTDLARESDDLELVLRLGRDIGFGQILTLTAGPAGPGADQVVLLPPFDPAAVARAVRSLRCWPLLDGSLDSPSLDVTGLERLVSAIGHLSAEVPQVAELDLGRVLIGVHGIRTGDVRVWLAHPLDADAGVPRRLRVPH